MFCNLHTVVVVVCGGDCMWCSLCVCVFMVCSDCDVCVVFDLHCVVVEALCVLCVCEQCGV